MWRPVTAIAAYTFDKCNEYWVTRRDETDALWNSGKRWPKTMEEELGYQERKSQGQTFNCFDKEVWKYEVSEQGGTTCGGEQYGGRSYVVVLTPPSCSCQMPLQIHLPCSHMITACHARGLLARSSTCLSPFYHMRAVRSTWAGRFEPYLDMAQWPKYNGPVYLPDSELMVKTKGRRQTKRFKMDIDRAQGGITLKRPRPQPQQDDYFVEDSVKNRCSACGEEGHKNTKKFCCEARKKQKAADEVITESAAANSSSSGSGIGPKRPRGTRHYRGARRRPKVVGRLAEVLGRKTQVIIFVEHIYYIRAYKFSIWHV